MPSALTILFCIVVFVALLTWFIPAGEYDYAMLPDGETQAVVAGSYHKVNPDKQGIWDIFLAPITGFVKSIDIGIYLMMISGFIALVMKTGAISSGISLLTKKLLGKEILLIPILMFLFSLCGTILGFWEETLGFYALVTPVFIAAGYDAIVGLLVVIWGAGLGLIGSTINPFATGIASELASIQLGKGMPFRLFMYILFFLLGTTYIMRYAKKVKDKPSSSLVFHLKESHENHFKNTNSESNHMTKVHKSVLCVFAGVFLILVMSMLPWEKTFHITFFKNSHAWLSNVPVLKDILGSTKAFGEWSTSELSVLFLAVSILVGFLGKFSEDDFIHTFFSGVSDVMSVVFVIAIANGVKEIMDDGHISATILFYGERLLSSLSGSALACASFLLYLPLSFLIPSSSGLATLSIPLLAPLADFTGMGRDIIVTAYQTANAIINLISPTSAVLMGALTITKIPYSIYIKSILKLLAVIVVILLVALYIAPLI